MKRMSTLLIITDHRFYKHDNVYYDDYVFNYNFFASYLEIFDQIKLLVRVSEVDQVDNSLQVSSGDNVEFLELPDLRRFKLLFNIKKYILNYADVIKSVDAVCYRLPSFIGNITFKEILSKSNVPHMFELIGDPEESLISPNDNFFISKIKREMALRAMNTTKNIVKIAVAGSYVSFNHLQNKYPSGDNALTRPISSIRLQSKYILSDLPDPLEINKLKIIHVGSFVEVKNQQLLIELTKRLVEMGIEVSLTFIGNGVLIENAKRLTKLYGLEDNVVFKGQVTGFDNVVSYLDKSNIFILPSLTEGMPRALIEAMSRGLICLGANRGGIAELLPENNLFDPYSVESAMEALLNIINNKELLEKSRRDNLVLARKFEMSYLQKKREEVLNHLKAQLNESN